MKKVLGFIVALATGFAVSLLAAPAAAAASPPPGTYVLDAQKFQTRSDVATLWAGAGVPIVVGSCVDTDPYCIKATVGNLECGTAGCSTYGTGACRVQVAQVAMHEKRSGNAGYDTQFNVLGHEVGHCILHSDWHATSSYDIMCGWVSIGLPRRSITSETQQQLALIGY